jgi:hypothetical protein
MTPRITSEPIEDLQSVELPKDEPDEEENDGISDNEPLKAYNRSYKCLELISPAVRPADKASENKSANTIRSARIVVALLAVRKSDFCQLEGAASVRVIWAKSILQVLRRYSRRSLSFT